MRFEWDDEKNARNVRKHGVSFETAKLVFRDRLAHTVSDEGLFTEERWIITGEVAGTVLRVVFAEVDEGDDGHVRIISARRASRHERRIFER